MRSVQTAFDFGHEAALFAGAKPNITQPNVTQPSAARPMHARPEQDSIARVAPTSHAERRDSALQLENALRAQVAVPLQLTITDNRRTMISLRRHPRFMEVRLHHMFLGADAATRDAVSDYLFRSDRGAAQHIGRFIEQHRAHIRRELPRRRTSLSTAGSHHDLGELFRAVNQAYFENKVEAHITWGRDPKSRRRRRSIKLGSYTSRERLIRVHPALDNAFVPKFFVAYIVYHEMLHHVLPPKVTRGRRDLHGPEFQARERLFVDYARALEWERDYLDLLLRL